MLLMAAGLPGAGWPVVSTQNGVAAGNKPGEATLNENEVRS